MSGKGRDDMLFVDDILTAIEKIETYTRNLSYEEFVATSVVIDAVIRNFEVIGEAAKKIPKRIKNRYPEIPWKEAAGFRDVLIHNYFGIDIEAVWDTVHSNIPVFKEQMLLVLRAETAGHKQE
jgi:uncharacterized protein with HEPN domain